MKVAIIAPPWLKIPPNGYGGIEVVLYNLIQGLVSQNVEVVLYSIGKTRIKGVKVRSLYKDEQYEHIHKPMYEAMPIVIAHQHYALESIRKEGDFDIIHDHNGFVGPLTLSTFQADETIPPAVHTLHGPPFSNQQMLDSGQPDNKVMWSRLPKNPRLYYIGISSALTENAPRQLRSRILEPVHNAVDADGFIYSSKKQNYFLTLARFCKDKGQHVAAKYCDDLGYNLRMAGTVASIGDPKTLALELANPLSKIRNNDDFRYFSDKILPMTIKNKRIKFIGNIKGKHKLRTISQAKALLFPIDWEEPFGMVVIEAMASGTPVVAMNRGAMPEIIEHGVNGFLANSKPEFKKYMQRVGEIDPEDCRKSVIDRFSSTVMASNYVERYTEAIERANQTD